MIEIKEEDIHAKRMAYCMQLMVQDLIALDNTEVLAILYRYTCAPRQLGITIKFPNKIKEESLPEHLRLPNVE